ncbi:EAL domain-containing protein [Desulfurella sp.]|uniref:EAL domain-containing protein n=1 Tax=Desulfurella sp. TaxID=1962857 RepID=UPI0025BA78C9|nr:EAL domain-containing protein [Desulfurella sp.]
MNQTKNNLDDIIYKTYAILIKDFEKLNFDILLDLVFDYLDLELGWIGIFSDKHLTLSKAKGKAIQYTKDETLRNYQINILEKYSNNAFVSNDVLEDQRLSYLKNAATTYGFNSIFGFIFQINDFDYGFILLYSKHKNYFDKHTLEILTNFSYAIKTAILISKKEKDLILLKDIVENSYQGVVITNSKNEIIYTNKAFSNITGYSFEEAKGKNPSILKSNYHSKDFYKDMWHKLIHNGHFEGKIYNKRKNGELYEEIIFIKTIKDENGNISYYFSFFSDLTELKKAQEQASYNIYHDPLTKLINQVGFFEQAQRIIEKNESFAIVYIDLDNFSTINTKFGIEKTDQLLKEFADFLRLQIADPKDIVSRFGSDEFIFLKRSIIEQNIVKFTRNTVDKIRQKSFKIDGQEIFLKVSAGIVLYPKDSDNINTLVNYAHASCRKAKQLGKNQCVFFNNSIYEEFINGFMLTNEIIHGIEFEEFELYFQPIYNTHSKAITHAEALIRWNHPKKGLLSPFYFIPFAESSDLIEKLDFYVLEKALESINEIKKEGLKIIISVNITGRTFLTDNFLDTFIALIDKYKTDPGFIKIELTESIALSDENKTIQRMQSLRKLGINFSMDDFGTGYSSILSLKKFPFSNIKLDQNFIMDMQNNQESAIISSHMLSMLNELNFETTAEGIENEYLFFLFNYLPCDLLQGYFISKPIPYQEFINFVKNFKPDSTFIEFHQNNSKILDLKIAQVKYFIYKYFKTIRNILQNNDSDKQLNDLSKIIEFDHKKCDFGKWYYSVYPFYGKIESFKSIEYLHIDIHKTAKKIFLEKNEEKLNFLFNSLKYKIMQLNKQFDNFYLQNFITK